MTVQNAQDKQQWACAFTTQNINNPYFNTYCVTRSSTTNIISTTKPCTQKNKQRDLQQMHSIIVYY